MKRFIITTAVNQARVHQGFWESLLAAKIHLDAELVVVAAKYNNPSTRNKKGEPDIYDPEVLAYLTRKRRALGKNLTLFADIPVQPTSGNPTSGMEVFCKDTSAIIGHVKRAMTVVPAIRHPRVLWTTGACTLPSYSKSRAGARAKEHHVLGALIVEVVGKTFFVRNVTANKDGSFTDLDATYTPSCVLQAKPALSVTAGDIHVGQDDLQALRALEGLVKTVQPKWLVLHDVLDMSSRSHHKRNKRHAYSGRFAQVDTELLANSVFLQKASKWGSEKIAVVASNHHSHLDVWLQDNDPQSDPINAPAYHRMWSDAYSLYNLLGRWVDPYEHEMRQRKVPKSVVFLPRGGSLRLAGVEHSLHGDKGANGARGSAKGFARLGCKVIVGHAHTPAIIDGAFVVGVTGRLDMEYTIGAPSSWLHAHVVLGADGKRQMIITQKESFRG